MHLLMSKTAANCFLRPRLRVPVRHLPADLPVVDAGHQTFPPLSPSAVGIELALAGSAASSRSRSRAAGPSAAGRHSPWPSMPPGSALVILTIDSRGAPVGQCTSGMKPLPMVCPNMSLRTSESVIQRRLQPAARRRLVRAGAEHRLVVGARVLGQPVGARLAALRPSPASRRTC